MSAIAVIGGHVARAIDFYHKESKYFVIGGIEAWDNESSPPAPKTSDFRLRDIIGLKRVDETYLVVPDPSGDIIHRQTTWRKVVERIDTYNSSEVTIGSTVVPVESVGGLIVGGKIRINNLYEGTIISMSGHNLTLDTPAPDNIPAGSPILGGALVDGAHYVYMICYLNYDEFPVMTYRQIGVCTGVAPSTENVLLSARAKGTDTDDYTSLGILEILDNRGPSTRDSSQREKLSVIIEF